jgi:hypothetical protein
VLRSDVDAAGRGRGRAREGGGAHQRGKDGRRCLLGSAHAAAQGGAAWGPHDGSGHR